MDILAVAVPQALRAVWATVLDMVCPAQVRLPTERQLEVAQEAHMVQEAAGPTEATASVVLAATPVVQASVVQVVWATGYRHQVLRWEAQVLLVEDEEVSAELMEALVRG